MWNPFKSKEPKPPKCSHNWVVVRAVPMVVTDSRRYGDMLGDWTVVQWHCPDCDKYVTNEIYGKWTMETPDAR